MKIKFVDPKLSKKNMLRLEQVNAIIADYAKQGYVLTLRQLYYRLVTKNIIANKVVEYDRLSHILTQGRLGGIVDWDAIEDRIRQPNLPYFNEDIEDAINKAAEHYRIDRMEGQGNYVELWVEKDAISSIMKRSTHHYGIRLMVNRGYSSTTAMYDAYNRLETAIDQGKEATILYLGDHDPSGLDMALKDIPKRLTETFKTMVNVEHIAITHKQIKKYDPPPNPAKRTDPRSDWYIAQYGEHSYEVDALEPSQLFNIVNEKIEALLDMNKFKAKIKQEEIEQKELSETPKILSKRSTAISLIHKRIETLEKDNKTKGTRELTNLKNILSTLL